MKGFKFISIVVLAFASLVLTLTASAATKIGPYVIKAGDPSLKVWELPLIPPYPENNKPTAARIKLGKMLFFEPRISGDGNMSCATCHNPSLGWTDNFATSKGFRSKVLGRATPTVINTAYNTIHMWDGRKKSLEDQALGPLESKDEMNADMTKVIAWLKSSKGYQQAFAKAYPKLPIGNDTIGKAIAAYERTIIVNDTPFDRWVRGDAKAMSKQQIAGFKLFVGKARCVACHMPPNFTDDGFHNIGLKSFGHDEPDLGRYKQRRVKVLLGAFKTPQLRNVARMAPYFHDGSATTLMAVMEHYNRGGDDKTNLSPSMKPLHLSKAEMVDLVAFMHALTSQKQPAAVTLPRLPID